MNAWFVYTNSIIVYLSLQIPINSSVSICSHLNFMMRLLVYNNKQISWTVLFPLNGNDPKTQIYTILNILCGTSCSKRYRIAQPHNHSFSSNLLGFFIIVFIYNICSAYTRYVLVTMLHSVPDNKLVVREKF